MFIPIAMIAAALLIAPLYLVYRNVKNGGRSKRPLLIQISTFFGVLLLVTIVLGGNALAAEEAEAAVAGLSTGTGLAYIAAALAVGLSGVGGGIAVASSAAAAIGAISENENTFGKALIFVAMAEGVALYGLLIAFMIITNL